MSYDIVKSIAIKNDKVYFTAAPNNVYPRTFERFEVPKYSDLYQQEGLQALLEQIGAHVWNGNYHLRSSSKLTKLLAESYSALTVDPILRHFLDDATAARFMAETTVAWMNDPSYNPYEAVQKLDLLRSDKDAVLSICEKNPEAFNYAAENVQEDRTAAKAFIEKRAGMTLFSFPTAFRDDKELVMLALMQNGCIYRQLQSLKSDKDVTKLAFDFSVQRRFGEHLPDLIPDTLIQDKSFMRDLISVCPPIHMHRRWDILDDPGCAETWIKNGKYTISFTSDMPKQYLQNPVIQTLLTERFEKENCLDRLYKIFEQNNIPFHAGRKPGLDAQIQSAQNKMNNSAANVQTPAKETEPQR